jgi:isoleucyl-tRNA synthetase
VASEEAPPVRQAPAELGLEVPLRHRPDDLLRDRAVVEEFKGPPSRGPRVTDRIDLSLTGDQDLIEAAKAHQDYLASEVLATTVSYDGSNGAAAKIDGRDLKIGVSRA